MTPNVRRIAAAVSSLSSPPRACRCANDTRLVDAIKSPTRSSSALSSGSTSM